MTINSPNDNNDNPAEQAWRLPNPHDRFCRLTACSPAFAPNFFRSYGDPVLDKLIDLDNLQEAPTTLLTDKLKELRKDAALITRLLDSQSMSEVLILVEHKSQPGRGAVIQLWAEAAMSLHGRWVKAGRPESGNIEWPIPILIIIYNGSDDWDIELWFQDFFTNLPVHFVFVRFLPFLGRVNCFFFCFFARLGGLLFHHDFLK